MNSFRTTFKISRSHQQVNYGTKILSLGSCFSENIGKKLTDYKFQALANPFGILYNPQSIANSLDFLLQDKRFVDADLFEYKGVWNSFYHHSRFSDINKNKCLENINASISKGSAYLKNSRLLLITFGTSWVYEHKQTGDIVSNCHKIPSKEFDRKKLTIDQITNIYSKTIKLLQNQNQDINIIFTVSPIRHLKDGVTENQLSKSTLILAIHNLVNEFDNVSYFPSYEIMMDDLRDYRFYNDDMTHPSAIAVDYIWNEFKETYIDSNVGDLMLKVMKINQAISHRPFNPESATHQKFLLNILKQINEVEYIDENMDFKEEKAMIKRMLV